MDYYRIGLIARPHGVRGALKLIPLSDDVNRFRSLKTAYLERDDAHIPITLYEISVQPDAVFVHIQGTDTVEAAEKLRNLYVCVDRANAVKLPEGSYFVADLIDCEVFDDEGTAYGKLYDVYETGSVDVYLIKGKRTLMVPALKKVLKSVDTEQKCIILYTDVLKEVGLFED